MHHTICAILTFTCLAILSGCSSSTAATMPTAPARYNPQEQAKVPPLKMEWPKH